jgi:DNA polymerase II small subunit/DNA polymerase delta subunit B
MIKRRFEVIHISDVHYGSPNVAPHSITAGLERALDINDPTLSQVDLISIDGDFFDSMFMMAEDVSGAALKGISHILRVAAKYRIPVDVLEERRSTTVSSPPTSSTSWTSSDWT